MDHEKSDQDPEGSAILIFLLTYLCKSSVGPASVVEAVAVVCVARRPRVMSWSQPPPAPPPSPPTAAMWRSSPVPA